MPDVSASFVPRVSASGAFVRDFSPRTLVDEFMGGTASVLGSSTSNANIGELNWNLSDSGGGGDVRKGTSTEEMLGWYQIEANASSIMGVYLGNNPSTSGGLPLNKIAFFDWRGTFNGPIFPVANGAGRFGIGVASAQSKFGSRALWFEYAPGSSSFLRTGSSFDGDETIRETSILWAQGAVYDMRIVRVSDTRYEFFVDGQLVSEHDTAHGTIVPPPDSLISFMAQAEAGAANHQIGMDRFSFLRA